MQGLSTDILKKCQSAVTNDTPGHSEGGGEHFLNEFIHSNILKRKKIEIQHKGN